MNKTMKKYKAIVSADLSGERLDKVLAQCFGREAGLSRRQFRDLISEGAAYVNRRRQTRLSQTVSTGDQVEFYLKESLATGDAVHPAEKIFEVSTESILFEDADLIFINKPAGLPSQPTLDSSRHNLYSEVQRYLRKNAGPEAYAGMHQRLDRDTSGVIFFTKTRAVNRAMAEQVSNHQIQKVYWALCTRKDELTQAESVVGQSFSVRDFLQRSRSKPVFMQAVHAGGDLAETSFTILKSCVRGDWIEARPRTGRMHQIRAHLASLGRPIFADTLYKGPRPNAMAPRVMLHAHSLEIRHPISGQPLIIVAPAPDDFLKCWDALQNSPDSSSHQVTS
jgi:23S rRNA pseudouridine955/2504/2580 synthase